MMAPPAARILFVSGEYPPMQGGVADYTQVLSRALVELGCPVAVLTAAAAEGAASERDGVEVFAQVQRWDWGVWRALDDLVQVWTPDVVHIQYQTAAYGMHPAINLWPWRPWRRPGVLTAVTFHDLKLPYLFPKAHLLRRWVTSTLARRCTLAITTNPEDSAALQPMRPHALEIPIGSNIPCQPPADFEREAWRRRLGLPADGAVLAYFGFLNRSKGGEALIDVLAELVRRGHDAHLLMIGGRLGASDPTNLGYLRQVEARIASGGLGQRVHWTGHMPVAEVSAAFLSADLCLLPYADGVSYRRGSFMAALAHGRAIVTTLPAAPYGDLRDGENVLLAPAEDAAALIAAAESVLGNGDLRQRLEIGASILAQRFTWEGIAARCLAAYAALLSPHRQGRSA